jgi:hypothetical protein
VQLILDMAAGEPINESLLVRRTEKELNSRGGKGTGSTMFTEFWDACMEILSSTTAAEERRKSQVVFASVATSPSDLIRQATSILQQRVADGKYDELPPVPCAERVRLAFHPNDAFRALASKFTGNIPCMKGIQMRTLRKQHQDQHWVNAYVRYYLEWMVELRGEFSGVEFFGQDDKAKIPCGDAVPVSSGVRAGSKGIVVVGDKTALKAMDHDFHSANIIPSVTLRCNIPSSISGSFFIGDDNGYGQIFVTLRCAVFDPSEVYDHCAQLVDTLRKQGLKPTVLVIQTDGGPDHSLKRVATKFALIAMFGALDLDHLVVLRCAPNGSAMNKVERAMSVLNVPLAHASIGRGDMSDWAESEAKKASSMSDLRIAGTKNSKERDGAMAELPGILRDVANALVAEALEDMIRLTVLESWDLDQQKSSSAVTVILRFLGIIKPDTTRSTLSTRGGQQVIGDSSLWISVSRKKQEKAATIMSRDFCKEWAESIGQPINELSTLFSRLKTGNQDVVVTPRVPEAAVQELHEQLQKIDPAWTPDVKLKAHLAQVPDLVSFISKHCIITQYSMSVQKCNNSSCCGPLRTPVEYRDLAMQRQPTPRRDPRRDGHFLCRADALNEAGGKESSLVDVADLPSATLDEKKGEAKERTKRDERVSKQFKLKSWDGKKVRATVACFECGKPRCVYSQEEKAYFAAETVLQQKLESVSLRYSCGDLLFPDNHHLSGVLVQRQSLVCESAIEKGYYNCSNRLLKLKDLCIYCGAEDAEGSNNFLLGMKELTEQCKTNGYHCFPICTMCLDKGKKIVTKGKQNALLARKEKEQKNKAKKAN